MSKSRGTKARKPRQHQVASARQQPPTLRSQKRIPGKPADYLAAELHEERLTSMDLRKQHLGLRQQLLSMQQLLLKKEDRILQLEGAAVDERNKALREEHGLAVGRTVHKDDETGEVYFMEEVEVDPLASNPAAPGPASGSEAAPHQPQPEPAGK